MISTPIVARASFTATRSAFVFRHVKNAGKYGHGVTRCYATLAQAFRINNRISSHQVHRPKIPVVSLGYSLRWDSGWSWASGSQLGNKRRIASTTPDAKWQENGKIKRLGKTWTTRQTEIPVGGNGSISLDISTPTRPSPVAGGLFPSERDVFVHFPPGIIIEPTNIASVERNAGTINQAHNDFLSSITLSNTSTLPVAISVNYRLSTRFNAGTQVKDQRFPTPIHDVSVALDWILDQHAVFDGMRVNGEQSTSTENGIGEPQIRVSLFGSHVGGALALMLALTVPNDIYAVAVHDPIVDWVGLDEIVVANSSSTSTPVTNRRRGKTGTEEIRMRTLQAANDLVNLRSQLFHKPSGFFDPFASPLLFLRASGRDTPLWTTAKPDPDLDIEHVVQVMKDEGGVEIDEKETLELINERGYGPYDDDWDTAGKMSNTPDNQVETKNLEQIIDAQELEHAEPGAFVVVPDDAGNQQPPKQLETDLSHPESVSQEALAYIQNNKDGTGSPPEQTYTDLSDLQNTSFDILPSIPHHESSTSPTTTSLDQALSSSPKRRRKVLRRWPPNDRPEDVELPYTKVFSTLPPSLSIDDHEENSRYQVAYILHPQAKEMVDLMRRACFWGREKSLGEERVELEIVESLEAGEAENSSVMERAVQWMGKISQIEKWR